MRLHKLFIEDFKILKNFTLEFPIDTKRNISVLIGENGAGKSTIMEAIAEIFSSVILEDVAKFTFSLEYTISRREIILDSSTWSTEYNFHFIVNIDASKDEAPRISVTLPNGTRLDSIEAINSDKVLSQLHSYLPSNLYKLLPDNIVIYYSGLSDLMSKICEKHKERFASNYRGGITNVPQVLFYYEPQLFKIILLTLLSFEYGDIPEFLSQKAGIDQLNRIQFTFHRPHWAKGGKIINHWNAKGEVKRFFDFLDSKREDWGIRMESILDSTLRITLTSQEMLFQLKDFFREERELFNVLYALYIGDFLEDIELNFSNQNGEFSDLSEGEQQSITIKGLTELLSEENSLFLFDEPDTYLHPKWQQKFISDLDHFIEDNSSKDASFIVSTHSPNLVSDVSKKQLYVLKEGHIIDVAYNSYGKPVDDILIDIFQLESLRNIDVSARINELRYLVVNDKYNESQFIDKLVLLKKILGDDDIDVLSIELEVERRKISGKNAKDK